MRATASSDALLRLSTTTTLKPFSRRHRHVCDPMYPAPPVTKAHGIVVEREMMWNDHQLHLPQARGFFPRGIRELWKLDARV